jgi:hypothetical protein
MGTRNKERRKSKKASRAKSNQNARTARPDGHSSAGRRGGFEAPSAPARQRLFDLIQDIVHASCLQRSDRADLVTILASGDVDWRSRAVVLSEIERLIRDAVLRLLTQHWEPVDLWEATRRQSGAGACALLAELMRSAILRADERWRPERLAACEGMAARKLDASSATWREDLDTACELLHVLEHLCPLADLRALGEVGAPQADVKEVAVLTKIRRLLAQAESTNYAEEADSFTAKATELMQRHRIDRAALEAAKGRSRTHGVAGRRCWLEPPYVEQKASLLHVVASAYGCRAVQVRELGVVTLVGELEDLEMTELLFTSLLLQATTQMEIIGRQSKAEEAASRDRFRELLDVLEDEGTTEVDSEKAREATLAAVNSIAAKRRRHPGFRRSFLFAYACRISDRLEQASRAATIAAEAEVGRGYLPVLAGRQQAVDRAVEQLFGQVSTSRVRNIDEAGWVAGKAAADIADLSVRDELAVV